MATRIQPTFASLGFTPSFTSATRPTNPAVKYPAFICPSVSRSSESSAAFSSNRSEKSYCEPSCNRSLISARTGWTGMKGACAAGFPPMTFATVCGRRKAATSVYQAYPVPHEKEKSLAESYLGTSLGPTCTGRPWRYPQYIGKLLQSFGCEKQPE